MKTYIFPFYMIQQEEEKLRFVFLNEVKWL